MRYAVFYIFQNSFIPRSFYALRRSTRDNFYAARLKNFRDFQSNVRILVGQKSFPALENSHIGTKAGID